MGAGGNPRPAPALADLLAVEVDALLRAAAVRVVGALRCQIGGAVPLPLGGALYIALGRGIPQVHAVRRRRMVLALDDLERLRVDRPARHERSLAAVGADDARPGDELVVHEQGEFLVSAAEGAEPVWDPHHPVTID